MPSKSELEQALINAHKAGDTEAATVLANALKSGYMQQQDDMTFGEKVKGTVGALGQMAQSAVVEPVAGLAGAGTALLTGDPAAGAYVVEDVKDRFSVKPGPETQRVMTAMGEYIPEVGKPMGEATMDLIGSPLAATVAETLPSAVMEVLGLKAPRIAAKLAKRKGRISADEARIIQNEIDTYKSGTATEEGISEVAESVTGRKASPETSVMDAEFDPAVVEAANNLGFKEIPPSVAAGNAQFRDMAQGLASMPGTPAKAQYGKFLETLANKADELITEGGGTLDKAEISARYKENIKTAVEDMRKAEGGIYDQIALKVDPAQAVDATNIRTMLDQQVANFGGVDELPKLYKDLHKMVYKKVDGGFEPKNPTYTALNQKRKEIGAAIGRKQSQYSDSEISNLKESYGALKQDQSDIASSQGFGNLQSAADAWTIKRKTLESSSVELLGKDLLKDLMPVVSTKIKGLPKGNIEKFKQSIDSIPEVMRQEVVVSALNDLMRGGGADQRALSVPRFAAVMADLNASPTAKAALYKYLPEKTRTSLDNMSTLVSGVYKANKENITTGKISTFFPDQRGFINRIIGKTAAAAAASKAGIAGAEAADAVIELMQNQTPSAVTANGLIASKQFQTLMREAVRDGVVDGKIISDKTKRLEKVVTKTKAYNKWAENLDKGSKAKLTSLGLTNYLMQANQESED